ncbi:ATPase [Ramlibacter sp. 2FC]|uniref:ATPase n=1 Tax=Ramlibacter sp. 2FC TaxID=2502188 RepID=UPI0014856655|nr:ATPase [Ramlibacter sp. 2FC]
MSLRPCPARWFEVLVAHDDVAWVLTALARTGAVELEIRAAASRAALVGLREPLAQYQVLARRYLRYWPRQELPSGAPHASPAFTLRDVLQQLEAWRREADPLIQALERLEKERLDALVWRDLWARLGDGALDFGRAARAGPLLQACLLLRPRTAPRPSAGGALLLSVDLGEEQGVLAVGPVAALAALAREAASAKGRAMAVPDWARGNARQSLAAAAARLQALDAELARLRGLLDRLSLSHRLLERLADVACLGWFVQQVDALPATENFSWLSGWTDDLQGQGLRRALQGSGARALLRLGPPPPGACAPLVQRNPGWARPFEAFGRLLGVPSANEVDPSQMLALVVPLMFGYMFGDVGQGLVLLAAGIALRRWPMARLLMAGGASAALFGLLYGSVFALEHLWPPLWSRPLEQPLLVLLVPLVGGMGLLTLGQLLAALEAHWRGELADWCWREGGLLAFYLGLAASWVFERGYLLLAAGGLWFLLGQLRLEPRPRALPAAAGELIEKGLQLVVNTLSFTRVGAFALAHAGLSTAIVALMQASEQPVVKGLILVAGNLLTVVLEGLVVSVQVTRLVLFEFFIRFLRAEGRPFRPLPAPPTHLSGGLHEPAS